MDEILKMNIDEVLNDRIFNNYMLTRMPNNHCINFYYFIEKLVRKITKNNDFVIIKNTENKTKACDILVSYFDDRKEDKLRIFYGYNESGYYVKVYHYKNGFWYKDHLTSINRIFSAIYLYIIEWYSDVNK